MVKKIIYLLFLLPFYGKSQVDSTILKERVVNSLSKKETTNFAPIERTLNPKYVLEPTKKSNPEREEHKEIFMMPTKKPKK